MSESGHSANGRELVTLDAAECLALLGFESIGRLAICPDPAAAPDVVTVNFVLDGGAPIFRTHDGHTLDHVVGRPASLQVERLDWFHRTGWSVLVQGTGELLDSTTLRRLDLQPWAPGPQPRLVRIVPIRITGRRIELHQRPLDGAGYL